MSLELLTLCLIVVLYLCFGIRRAHATLLPTHQFIDSAIFQALPTPLYILDARTARPRAYNTAGKRLLDLSHDDTKPFAAFFEDNQDSAAFFQALRRNELVEKTSYPLTLKQGKRPLVIDIIAKHNQQTLCSATPLPAAKPAAHTHQNNLLAVISASMRVLFSSSGKIKENLRRAIKLLGNAANVDRVYVWQIYQKKNSTTHAQKIVEWSTDANPYPLWHPRQKVSFPEAMPSIYQELATGRTVQATYKNLPPAEQSILGPRNVTSIFLAPIILNDKLWGVIGFDDCQNERSWTYAEEEALRTVGLLIGTTLSLFQTNVALKEAQKRFQDIALATGEVICELDSRSHISYISEKSLDVLGISAPQVIGKHVISLVGDGKRLVAFRKSIRRQIKQQGFFRNLEHTVLDSKGRVRHLSSSGLPLYDVNGCYKGLRLTSIDISKNVENRNLLRDALSTIRQANEELEEYAKITEDLAIQADNANRAKSDFLANVSHEVRTPIHIISGMAYLARQSQLTAEQEEYISKIQGASNSLLEIMNNIIEFAQMTHNQLELAEQPFRFKKNLLATIQQFREATLPQEVTLSSYIDPSIPTILLGDPTRVLLLFKNLINNAVKYTEQGNIHVSCLLQSVKNDQATLSCAIADTGIGISPDIQENLFATFSQGDASSTRRYSGTGLGLALSKQLVEAMQGHISVISGKDTGTTFSFNITLGLLTKLCPAQLCYKQTNLLPSTEGHPPKIIGSRILLVSATGIPSTLQNALTALRLETTVATSLRETKNLIEQSTSSPPFELTIVNGNAKEGFSPLECGEKLRQIPHLADVPIVILTECLAKNSDVCPGHINGFSGCIAPATKQEEIQERLESWLIASATQQKNNTNKPSKATLLESQSKIQVTPSLSSASLQQLQTLRKLLEDDDAAAHSLALEMKPLLLQMAPQKGAELLHAVCQFDFSRALSALENLSIPLPSA